MTEINPPSYLANGCYTAQNDRSVYSSIVCTEGVAFGASGGDYDDLEVTPGTGLAVSVGSGTAFIEGDSVPGQGMYHVVNEGPTELALAGADPTDGRADLVVATISDATYGGTDTWVLQVITGTPSPAPTPPAVPLNSIPLAGITVPAGASSIVAGNITDLRMPYGLCSEGGGAEQIVYTASGTFVKADHPGLRAIKVRGVGGGGGGSGSQALAAGEASSGDGGGGGGYFECIIPAEDLPVSVTVTVGGGGSGAAVGGTGVAGGTTSFGTFGSGDGGGSGNGQIAAGTAAALRGAANNGGAATCPTGIAIPGSSARTGAIRVNGTNAVSGAGGNSQLGRGGRPIGGTSVAGIAGGNYGGGGSGGSSQNGGAGAGGGAGAPGAVIIEIL